MLSDATKTARYLVENDLMVVGDLADLREKQLDKIVAALGLKLKSEAALRKAWEAQRLLSLPPSPTPQSPQPPRGGGGEQEPSLAGYQLQRWIVPDRVGQAISLKSGADVAFKVLARGDAGREAEALKSLAQSAARAHVVALVEHLEDDNHAYLVMELLGEDAARYLKVRRATCRARWEHGDQGPEGLA